MPKKDENTKNSKTCQKTFGSNQPRAKKQLRHSKWFK
jgi:hypothetical protein